MDPTGSREGVGGQGPDDPDAGSRRREAEQDQRTDRKLRAEQGREPSSGEIAVDFELSVDEVDQIRRSAQTPVSAPVGDDEESEFGHFITDELAPLPDELAEDVLRREALTKILGTLSERERRVLELRYGLNGEQPRTLDEVGRTFQVTRERIRQIENQSLKKLRALALTEAPRGVRRRGGGAKPRGGRPALRVRTRPRDSRP